MKTSGARLVRIAGIATALAALAADPSAERGGGGWSLWSASPIPTANAGRDQTAAVGTIVMLDASASTDADGGQLTFAWHIESAPRDSHATLSDPTSLNP